MLTTSFPSVPELFDLSGPAPVPEPLVSFECLAGTPDAYFITIPADSDPLLIQQLENRFCDGFMSDRRGFLAWLADEATLPRALIASVALLKDPALEVKEAAAALLVNFPDFHAAPAIIEAWVPPNRPETPRESKLYKPARDALDSLRFHAVWAVREIAEEVIDRELHDLFPTLISVGAAINPFEARRAFKWIFAANQCPEVTALKLESIADNLGPRGAALSFLLECARLSIVDDRFTESSIFFPFRDPASRFLALWRAAPRYRSLFAAEFCRNLELGQEPFLLDAPVMAAALGSWHTESPDEDRFPLESIANGAFAVFEKKPKANHFSTVEVIARTDLSRSFCPLLLDTLSQKSPDRDIQAAAIISALVYNRDYFDEAPEKLLSEQLNPRYSQARRRIAVAALGILAQRSPSAIRAMASTGRSLQSNGPDKIGEQLMYDAAMLARRNFPGQNILARPNSDDSD